MLQEGRERVSAGGPLHSARTLCLCTDLTTSRRNIPGDIISRYLRNVATHFGISGRIARVEGCCGCTEMALKLVSTGISSCVLFNIHFQ